MKLDPITTLTEMTNALHQLIAQEQDDPLNALLCCAMPSMPRMRRRWEP